MKKSVQAYLGKKGFKSSYSGKMRTLFIHTNTKFGLPIIREVKKMFKYINFHLEVSGDVK